MGKVFNFFSGSGKGTKGITKQQVKKDKDMGFLFFFKLLKNRLGNISSTSLLFSLCNFPILVFFLGLSGNFDTFVPAPSSPFYSVLYGMEQLGIANPNISYWEGLYGASASVSIVSTVSKVLLYFGLLTLVTLGISSIGTIYNLRSVTRCEPLSPWAEFFPTIRKNIKQGIPLIILDAILIPFFAYDLLAYYSDMSATGNYFTTFCFYIVVLFAVIYFIMRYFAYLILVTFDLKFSSLLKNAFYLTFLGWKRTLAALLGSAAVVLVSFYAYMLLPSFGILLPFVIGFGLLNLIGVYCAYPVIERYMIEPYYKDHPEERPGADIEEVESIFTDRG